MSTPQQLGFTIEHRIGLFIFSILLFGLILELVRRRQFKERYALLWLATSLFGVLVGVFPTVIVWISKLVHVQFLTVFVALAFVFLLGLVLSFSVVISRLSEQNRELAQELALLANRLRHWEEKDGLSRK
jgi:choline-glycine betaine transporter